MSSHHPPTSRLPASLPHTSQPQVATLSRDDLYECLKVGNHQASARLVREAAMKIAVQRAIVIISECVRIAKVRSRRASAACCPLSRPHRSHLTSCPFAAVAGACSSPRCSHRHASISRGRVFGHERSPSACRLAFPTHPPAVDWPNVRAPFTISTACAAREQHGVCSTGSARDEHEAPAARAHAAHARLRSPLTPRVRRSDHGRTWLPWSSSRVYSAALPWTRR